jgi:probable F420-dependent oxidoreductase
MRVGLTLPHYGFSLPGAAPITFATMAEVARRAEDMGFDALWISDHLFYSFGRYGADPAPIASLEPMTSLAALATMTSRVRLGTLVLGAPFRHPSVVAKMAATVDGLSGGRLELGVGAGWLADEFDAFGYDFGSVGERFASLAETLGVLEALFVAREPVTGTFGTVDLREAALLPAPAQRPIPLWVGGKGGPKLLRLAARHATGWNWAWRVSPEAFQAKGADVVAACRAEGRDPATFRRTVGLYATMGRDEAEAREAFERGRAAFPGEAMDADTYEGWCADTLSGTVEEAAERLAAFETMGADEVVIAPWVLPFATPEPALVERAAEAVARWRG